ncbi:MAG: YfhO family protein [Schleiferiaceae bacterium]
MFKNSKILHFLLPIIGLLIVNFIYFYPALQGKVLEQDDIKLGYAKGKEIRDYREDKGEEPLWTDAMFSGMPTFQISTLYPNNWLNLFQQTVSWIGGKSSSVYIIFSLMFGFYLALIAMKIDPWLAAVGSIAFAFSAFFIISYGAGHNAKVRTAAYIAPVVMGVLMAYRGKLLAGFSLTALFVGMSIFSNHFQITYYLAILIVIIGVVEFVYAVIENTMAKFFKASLVLLAAALIGIGPNIGNLWSTYEYTKETMRGGSSELSVKSESKGGLSFEYAMSWSYGLSETFNLIYPNFSGGGSKQMSEGTEYFEKYHSTITRNLQQRGTPKKVAEKQASQIIAGWFYWGDQSMVYGGYYIGAVVFFLFVFALFVVKGRIRSWVIAATVFSLLLAWGKNAAWLNEFLFDYLPIYSKFRVPSMTFVILFFTVPFYGFLGINKVYTGELSKVDAVKYGKYALYVTGGLSLFFILFGGMLYDFVGPSDVNLEKQMGLDINLLIEDRIGLLKRSAVTTLAFCAAGFLWIWAVANKKIKPVISIAALLVLILFDQWTFDKVQLNADSFSSAKNYEAAFAPSGADQFILKDQDIHYRVWNTTAPLKSDSYTSYHHKSIGGYHGAKLIKYEDLIDYQLSKQNMACFDMLNAKWFIVADQQGQLQPSNNPGACGAAWIVNDVIQVENADAEMEALNSFAPKTQVIVDKRYAEYMSDVPARSTDSTSTIDITSYDPKHMVYEANITSPIAMAVFSEIYYEGGDNDWKVKIDGEPVDHIRVNYLLRGLKVPQGKHTIEFTFEPRSYYMGESISLVFSILLFAALGLAAFRAYKDNGGTPNEEDAA